MRVPFAEEVKISKAIATTNNEILVWWSILINQLRPVSSLNHFYSTITKDERINEWGKDDVRISTTEAIKRRNCKVVSWSNEAVNSPEYRF